MQIERLTPDEPERLRAVRLRALQDAPLAFGSTYEDSASRSLDVWRTQLEQLATFVAVVDGQDLGMVRGCALASDADTAELLSMWVDPRARGRGAGEALIGALIEWARTQGFSRMVLDVGDDNAPAVALYARMGFAPTGVVGSLPPPREHVREHQRALRL